MDRAAAVVKPSIAFLAQKEWSIAMARSNCSWPAGSHEVSKCTLPIRGGEPAAAGGVAATRFMTRALRPAKTALMPNLPFAIADTRGRSGQSA
jgi:hypothetical protein